MVRGAGFPHQFTGKNMPKICLARRARITTKNAPGEILGEPGGINTQNGLDLFKLLLFHDFLMQFRGFQFLPLTLTPPNFLKQLIKALSKLPRTLVFARVFRSLVCMHTG